MPRVYKTGDGNPNWRGGFTVSNGYVLNNIAGMRQHRYIAEQVLGRPLPKKAQIHHVDGNGLNNAHSNLVICEDIHYHKLLHVLARVKKSGGRPFLDKICHKCGQCKPKTEFARNRAGRSSQCRACVRLYYFARKARKLTA